jgi:hypothetical protein
MQHTNCTIIDPFILFNFGQSVNYTNHRVSYLLARVPNKIWKVSFIFIYLCRVHPFDRDFW